MDMTSVFLQFGSRFLQGKEGHLECNGEWSHRFLYLAFGIRMWSILNLLYVILYLYDVLVFFLWRILCFRSWVVLFFLYHSLLDIRMISLRRRKLQWKVGIVLYQPWRLKVCRIRGELSLSLLLVVFLGCLSFCNFWFGVVKWMQISHLCPVLGLVYEPACRSVPHDRWRI